MGQLCIAIVLLLGLQVSSPAPSVEGCFHAMHANTFYAD